MPIRRLSFLCLVGAALAATSGARAADFSTEWSRCVATIQEQYYAAQTKKNQLNALFRQYREAAVGAGSRSEFVRIVNEMIGKLGDSHFELHGSDHQSFFIVQSILDRRPSPQPFIGAYFVPDGSGWRAEMVFNGSSAEKAGLRKGDRVLKANGEPFSPIGSLKRAGGSVRLQVDRAGKSISLDAAVENVDFAEAAAKASQASKRIIETGGKKIGYIRLWMMLGDGFLSSLTDAATETFRDTDAMILDLRDGFGGYYDRYADVFFRPPTTVERKGQRISSVRAYGYRKPLAVLINGGTRSAKETLAYMLKTSGRATLIGTRTAGKLLGSGQFRISDWAILQVPVVDVWLDGKRLEGVGVEPDIEVKTEFDPSGEDLVLKEALKALSKNPVSSMPQ